ALQTMKDLTTKARGQTPPISVIIVDSSSLLVDSFQQIMKCAGFNVETAKSGEEAICRAEIMRFDLAIVDYNLIDIAGRDLTNMLKEQTPGISVILLNGSVEDKGSNFVKDVGLKAVDPQELIKSSRFVNDNR
ncbi:MAG: response regulator, partial [Candidatus Bathyarchaeota archaeon]|nr:response regulator [Candidatus Bathyarchaeota archaeon]